MAALRPVVLVFQEFAEVSAAAEVPDLETLIAGPAYHCVDYPADSGDGSSGAYGSQTADNILTGGGADGLPLPGADAIVLSDPPGNITGALLDNSSVRLWAENALLQITDGDGDFTTTSPNENLFTGNNSENFGALGVLPGDRLVVTDSGGSATVLFTIQEVGGVAGSTLSTDELRTTSNFSTSGTDISGAAYSGISATGLIYRIERRLTDAVELSSSFFAISGNEIIIEGGITYLTDINNDGADESYQVNYADTYIEYRSLRQDLADVGEISDPGLIEATIGAVDERNPLATGVFVALQNTTTSVKYYGVLNDNLNGAVDRLSGYTSMLDAIEARSDVYCIVPLANELSIISAINNSVTALADPEVSNFRIVVGSSAGLPEEKIIAPASETGVTEETTGDAVNVLVDTAEDFEAAGARSGDTLAIVTDANGTSRVGSFTLGNLIDQGDGFFVDSAFVGASGDSAAASYYILRGAGATQRTLTSTVATVSASETINIADADRNTDDVGRIIRLSGTLTDDADSPVGNNDYLITAVGAAGSGGGSLTAYTVERNGDNWTASDSGVAASIINPVISSIGGTVVTRQAFRQILDTSATFVTDGVIVGDLIEVPLPPVDSGTDFSGSTYTAAVASIESEQRIILEAGADIPAPDSTAGYTGGGGDSLGYRVVRALDKASQVDELVSVVESLNSKRVVMVWPDSVELSGVQNNNTGVATAQPGYYLACVVGGLSAGLPPHQGFTNLGIAGVDKINNSTRYFTESQLTELSNAGWYLFVQETDSSLPFCLHQLTTDVSTTQSGELSLVRTFDFVSLFYKDILDDFLGRYNVIDSTIDILREALNGGTAQLQSQRLPRIGAPLISATVESIEPFEGQADRVDVRMIVDFPVPLNRIGLRLIA